MATTFRGACLANFRDGHKTCNTNFDISSSIATLPKVGEKEDIYQYITTYLTNSQRDASLGFKVVNIYGVNGDSLDLRNGLKLNSNINRMLLWHGTPVKNIPSIIQNGFKLPRSGGEQRFGPGIYFADRALKSAKYCCSPGLPELVPGSCGFLLLCDVEVGKPFEVKIEKQMFTSPPIGFDSVKALGQNIPDPKEHINYHGICIPLGKTVADDECLTPLCFNEYVVYSKEKVKQMYLVEFRCAVASNPGVNHLL